MSKCDCYCERVESEPRYSPYTGEYINSVDVKYGYCNGTKERDKCSCGGNRTKCDFYPEIREKAMREKIVSGIPISRGYLSCWYIASVDDSTPIWTEEHLDELFEDFYLIPKEK